MISDKNEERLVKLIDKWVASQSWRKDFKRWREARIWQGKKQEPALKIISSEKKSGKLVLDIGSGMGGLLVSLNLHGWNAVGVDLNQDYCLITKLRGKRYKQNVAVASAVAEILPFQDGSFDIVFCYDVLEHVRAPLKVLQEIQRVLSLEGKAFVTATNKRAFVDNHFHLVLINYLPKQLAEKYISFRGRKKDYHLFKDMQKFSSMHYYTWGQFTKILDREGFLVRDPKLELIRSPQKISNPELRKAVSLLNRFGLAEPFYHFLQNFYLDSFFVLLEKKESA